jgi:hypothetical protein
MASILHTLRLWRSAIFTPRFQATLASGGEQTLAWYDPLARCVRQPPFVAVFSISAWHGMGASCLTSKWRLYELVVPLQLPAFIM